MGNVSSGTSFSTSSSREKNSDRPPVPDDLPIGRLELCNGGEAQCVLTDLPGGGTALITCHHVLPRLSAVTGGRLVFSSKAAFDLSPKRFSSCDCRSCCGAEGVWNTKAHFNDNCPYKNDWTVLTLEPNFASEIRQKKHFESFATPTFDHSTLQSVFQKHEDIHLYIFKRTEVVNKTSITLITPESPASNLKPLDARAEWYKKASVLRYHRDPFWDVGPGCSGAPIFGFYEGPVDDSGLQQGFNLVGIHHSSPSTGSGDQYGISLDYLLNCYKDGADCSLDSLLSFVKEALEYKLCLCEPMDKLAAYLKAHRSSDSEENLQLLEFVFQAALSRPLSDLNREEQKSVFNLLTTTFSCCPYQVIDGEDFESVVKQVEDVCKLLLIFMKSPDRELVPEAFTLWYGILIWECPQELRGCTSNMLDKVESYLLLKQLRDNKEFTDDARVQVIFGDIVCIRHYRYKIQMEKKLISLEGRIEELQSSNSKSGGCERDTEHVSEDEDDDTQKDSPVVSQAQVLLKKENEELKKELREKLGELKEKTRDVEELEEENERQARELSDFKAAPTSAAPVSAAPTRSVSAAPSTSWVQNSAQAQDDRFERFQGKTSRIVDSMDNFSMETKLFEKRILNIQSTDDLKNERNEKKRNFYIVQWLCGKRSHGLLDKFMECLKETACEHRAHEELYEELLEHVYGDQ